MNNQILSLKSNEWIKDQEEINGFHVLIKAIKNLDGKAMKEIAADLKGKDANLIVFFYAINNDKVVFVSGVGKEAIAKKRMLARLSNRRPRSAREMVAESRI